MQEQNENKKRPKWLTANREFYPHLKPIRDELKNETTEAEKLLWEQLRNKKLGVKFRRQHVVDCYIPDFVALSINLIIEVDGKIHLARKKEDAERTQKLELLGYKVIRFTNEEVETRMEWVLKGIKKAIEECKNTDLS